MNSSIEKFNVNDVMSVYSGQANKCACGCSGKYSYASNHVESASKEHGYEVTSDEVSDRSIVLMTNKFNKHIEAVEDYGDGQYVLELGKRMYFLNVIGATGRNVKQVG